MQKRRVLTLHLTPRTSSSPWLFHRRMSLWSLAVGWAGHRRRKGQVKGLPDEVDPWRTLGSHPWWLVLDRPVQWCCMGGWNPLRKKKCRKELIRRSCMLWKIAVCYKSPSKRLDLFLWHFVCTVYSLCHKLRHKIFLIPQFS